MKFYFKNWDTQNYENQFTQDALLVLVVVVAIIYTKTGVFYSFFCLFVALTHLFYKNNTSFFFY